MSKRSRIYNLSYTKGCRVRDLNSNKTWYIPYGSSDLFEVKEIKGKQVWHRLGDSVGICDEYDHLTNKYYNEHYS